jgi:hypothetical protein
MEVLLTREVSLSPPNSPNNRPRAARPNRKAPEAGSSAETSLARLEDGKG